ncbi:MAG: alpha-mannosidase [Anaerolineales bacterium]
MSQSHTVRRTADKIRQRLALIQPLVYRRRLALTPWRYRSREESGAEWQAVPPHTYWAGSDTNFTLQNEFAVPPEFDPERPVALYLPLGDAGEFSHPEALAFIDGRSYASVDRHHREIPLSPAHRDGRSHALTLQGWTGILRDKEGARLLMGECAVVQIDPPTREFVAVARTALQAADLLDDQEPARTRLLNVLDAAFKALDTREPLGEAFYAGVPEALRVLRSGIAQTGPPLDADIIAVGHAHIDVAWLWPLAQTRRKVARTFHTVLRLMEAFPDFHFTQSQPQLYDFIRQDDPALFEQIQALVEKGRWEPIGGMWVEADCNVTGSESLARQFLLGRTFFREHFGVEAETPVLWLPDVFGYAWNLPQLIKLAGLEYFFTIKLGWNKVNAFPYDSFWWQGLDGTRVLTHFSTAPSEPWEENEPDLMNCATYNANLNAFTALGAWVKLKHKETQRTLLVSYGYGNGGGGPTREMNENARELRAFPALPRVQQGTVREFFHRLEDESGKALPTWNGELYLEIHRGTYTTQSRIKRANRKSEFLLHDAEFLATWASLLDPGYDYPAETFREAWRLVCLNQFHDILPGTSIGEVYREAGEQHEHVRRLGAGARSEALAAIAAHTGGDLVVANPTGFRRDDLILWPGELPEGQRFAGGVITQPVEEGTLIGGVRLEPYSVRALHFEPESARTDEGSRGEHPLDVAPDHLENALLRVELNAAGDITRIYDKDARREVLPPGAVANQFQAFEDRPVEWDAWDIDIFYGDKRFLAEPADSIRVVEEGPLRATLEIRRRILNSPYTQRISLAYNSPRLDCETVIDWRERHILLKAAFPVEILAPQATYEIQWGHVERPTHHNTSWDWARFETAAQKWVDLHEGGYGVALLNDCKYGHDIQDNVIRISLLRAPTEPDPEADQGEHRFTYSLYPHPALPPYAIARQAYALNDPALAIRGGGEPGTSGTPPRPLIRASEGLIVETLKRAEDGRGFIVRAYECNRQRGPATLEVGLPVKAATLTNLLEEDQSPLKVEGRRIDLQIRPFQILNVRVEV